MAIRTLPAQGSTNWYGHYSDMDLEIRAAVSNISFLFENTHIDLFYVNSVWEPIPAQWPGKIFWHSIGYPDAPQPNLRAGDIWLKQE